MVETASPFYVTSGTMDLDAPSYVRRAADNRLLSALLEGEFCYILDARQVGKSSLMVRTSAALRRQGFQVGVLDLAAVGRPASSEMWYRGLLVLLGESLGSAQEEALDRVWQANADLAPLQRWLRSICDGVLETEQPLVIFVDEIDYVMALGFSADEFFAGIRQCYTGRAMDPRLARLTFCLLGTASPDDLTRESRTTPFNIGRRIELTDFTEREAGTLALGFGPTELGRMLLRRILYWTSGHPYLTQRLCAAVYDDLIYHPMPNRPKGGPRYRDICLKVDHVCSELLFDKRALITEPNFAGIQLRILKTPGGAEGVLSLYEEVRSGRKDMRFDPESSTSAGLMMSGLVRIVDGQLRPRNRIYAKVFGRAWVREHLAPEEVIRQRRAYRRGLRRAALIATPAVLLIAWLAWQARVSGNEARGLLYLANMNLVQHAWEADRPQLRRVSELLSETRDRGFDNFEWLFWWRASHAELVALRGHAGHIRAVAWTPDGKHAVSIADDNTVRIWDVEHGRGEAIVRCQGGGITAAAVTPDGRTATVGNLQGVVDIIDIASRRVVRQIVTDARAVTALAITCDGKRILRATRGGGADVWDVQTGKSLVSLPRHLSQITVAAFSDDGGRIVTGHKDYAARVWNARTGERLARLEGHENSVSAVAFSDDGRRIATGSADRTVRIWDAGGRCIRVLEGHAAGVSAVQFSHRGDVLLTGSYDNTARLWSVRNGRCVLVTKGHADTIECVAFSPDERRFLAGDAEGVAKVWSSTAWPQPIVLSAHHQNINAICYSADGRRILTCSDDQTARLWDVDRGTLVRTLSGHSAPVNCAALSPDRSHAITCGDDGIAYVWDLATGHKALSLCDRHVPIRTVAYDAAGTTLMTAGVDGSVELWDARTGRNLFRRSFVAHAPPGRSFVADAESLSCAALSPDGRRVVACTSIGTAYLWDIPGRTAGPTLHAHVRDVRGVAFSRDGRLIVTASWDGTARVWDASTGVEVASLKEHSGPVEAATFSPDARRIVTAGQDRVAHLWDTASGREVLSFRGYPYAVTCTAFSPDGLTIVTGTEGGTVWIWRAASSEEVTAYQTRLEQSNATGASSR